MTKANLIEEVSHLMSMTREDSEVAVEAIFERIVRSLYPVASLSGSIPGNRTYGSANQEIGLQHQLSLVAWGFTASYGRGLGHCLGSLSDNAVYRPQA